MVYVNIVDKITYIHIFYDKIKLKNIRILFIL